MTNKSDLSGFQVTGAVLAGGRSRRFKSDKCRAVFRGRSFLSIAVSLLSRVSSEILVAGRQPDFTETENVRLVRDLYAAPAAITGLHSALFHARYPTVAVMANDLPLLDVRLFEIMLHIHRTENADAVVPVVNGCFEPLAAVYSTRILPELEHRIESGQFKISAMFNKIRVIPLKEKLICRIDPEKKSFTNINTPADFFRLQHACHSSREI